MTMPKYVREELLKMLKNQRQDDRCGVVRGLIKTVHDEHPELWAEHAEARERLDIINSKLVQVKTDNFITDDQLARYRACRTCGKNPIVDTFDTETDRLVAKMLVDDDIALINYGIGEKEA